MRKPEQSAEPSIEEILASIRKIIADDGSQPPARAATLAEVPETPQRRRDPEPPRRPLPHPVEAFYPEPAEPAAAFGEDDDILELTEDSMVEDGAAQSATAFADPMAPADVRQFEPLQASSLSGRSAPPSGEELESAFSSVVAEVQRLSGGLKPAAEIGAASQDWAEPAITPLPKAPRQALVDEPWDTPATAAEPTLRPAPTRPAQPQARPASKPVWSARRLDSEGPRVRALQPAEESPAGKPAPAPRQNMAGQEGWAEGVQMRVPEGGPATPFPQSELLEGDTDDGDTAPPLSGSGESHSEIDKEKTFVGEMLTRVFGGAQKKAPEAPPAPPSRQPHADVRLAKAEDLAKATIADFASDKLRAPSVAQALHADRPFMDAITDSLATAMAEVEADRDSRTSARAAAQPDDELADAMLPPDIEAGMFGAPEQPSATAAQASFGNPFARQPGVAPPRQTPPFAEPPELPRSHSGDAFADPDPASRQTHSEIFGAAPEVDRAAPAAMPARTPSKPEPTAMMKSATAPADHAASPGAAFPAGLEDSIKDMIKPLIVQWLNDNLPRIVERAVREEISDQGLVARVRGEGGSRH